jgi:hypothetical protein
LANPAVTVAENDCFINLSKQIGVNQTINWRFHHALAKLDVQIVAACDVATEGTNEYTPDEESIPVDPFTGVYLRWIEFSGFAMSGALSLNSKAPQAHWLNYDGATELKAPTIRFNDGLLNGKEGILDNVNPNEVVLGALNPELIEEPTPLVNPDDVQKPAWLAKNKGIPTDKYANVFAGATEDKTSFFVIPTNAPLTINMLYDIETMDTQLNKYLSDGVTPGTRISNEITKELTNVPIVAGKAYTIKIVVGLESVKVDVKEVADWELPTDEEGNEIDTTKVDMPYNPAQHLTMGLTGTFLRRTVSFKEADNGTEIYKNPVKFEVIGEYTDDHGKRYLQVRNPDSYAIIFWVEEEAIANNGKPYKTYKNSNNKPGDQLSPTVNLNNAAVYADGGFDEVRFYTPRPFEAGMEGKIVTGDCYFFGSFSVDQDPDNPALVIVTTTYINAGGVYAIDHKKFNKTTMNVNNGKTVYSDDGKTRAARYIVE